MQRSVLELRYTVYGEAIDPGFDALDINGDGVVDPDDLAQFIAWFFNGNSGESGAFQTDYNGNGEHDPDDLADYIAAFFAWDQNNAPAQARPTLAMDHGALSRPGVENRLGYCGYVWDRWLQVYHVRHRVYEPYHGRWYQPDPIGFAGGRNWYEYCGGQPGMGRDSMGLEVERHYTINRDNRTVTVETITTSTSWVQILTLELLGSPNITSSINVYEFQDTLPNGMTVEEFRRAVQTGNLPDGVSAEMIELQVALVEMRDTALEEANRAGKSQVFEAAVAVGFVVIGQSRVALSEIRGIEQTGGGAVVKFKDGRTTRVTAEHGAALEAKLKQARRVDVADGRARLVENSKHHPNATGRATPAPKNQTALYERSVVGNDGERWALENGEYHRFSKPSNGNTHWNGCAGGPNGIKLGKVPNPVKKELRGPL